MIGKIGINKKAGVLIYLSIGVSVYLSAIALTDAATKKELRKKGINSSNNAIAAAWAFGANDRSLPSDMGEIIADYILSTVPHK